MILHASNYSRLPALLVCAFLGVSSVPLTQSFARHGIGFWSADGRDFYFNSRISLGGGDNSNSNTVMVSYIPGSGFSNSVKSTPNMIAYFTDFKLGLGRAVIAGVSPEGLDRLAIDAHRDIHACGAIEILQLNQTRASLGDADSPKIPTSVILPGVDALLDGVSSVNLKATVTTLEQLGTRFHSNPSVNATDTVEGLWRPLLPNGATLTRESHTGSIQQSVIVKIPGSDTSASTVILGAHLDSINSLDTSIAPGADDDASGIAALTEILRLVKSSGATFSRNIEFHAYAAEEVGLIGSKGLAAAALAKSQKISSMLQLDMIGYSANGTDQAVYIITTDTSPVLVRHLKDLASGYLGGNWKEASLPAGTSDHRSWSEIGFHASFAFENPLNYSAYYHSAQDKSEHVDFGLATKFTKLALAFLAHEAGLQSVASEASSKWSDQTGTKDFVKMAVSRRSTGGYRIAAAVPQSLGAQAAELCKVISGQELGCQSLVTTADLAKNQNQRTFFVSTDDLLLATGDLWRFHVYGPSGSLVAVRTVKLKSD
jgi:leucyl aminopeptidase